MTPEEEQKSARLQGLAVQLLYAHLYGSSEGRTRWSPLRALSLWQECDGKTQEVWLEHARKVAVFAGVSL